MSSVLDMIANHEPAKPTELIENPYKEMNAKGELHSDQIYSKHWFLNRFFGLSSHYGSCPLG